MSQVQMTFHYDEYFEEPELKRLTVENEDQIALRRAGKPVQAARRQYLHNLIIKVQECLHNAGYTDAKVMSEIY